MQVSISASGTPEQVQNSVATQIKRAARDNPKAWPALSTLRDYTAAKIAECPPGGSITVSATATVTITVTGSVVEHHIPTTSDVEQSTISKTKK